LAVTLQTLSHGHPFANGAEISDRIEAAEAPN
jgi:hypothetical protein